MSFIALGRGLAPLGACSLLLAVLVAAAICAPEQAPPRPNASDRIVVDERGVKVGVGPLRSIAVYMGIGPGEFLLNTRDWRHLETSAGSDNAYLLHNPYLDRIMPGLARTPVPLSPWEGGGYDYEVLLRNRPTVLITWARLAHSFERLGLPVVAMKPVTGLLRHEQNTRVYEALEGDSAHAEDLIQRLDASRHALSQALRDVSDPARPRVAVVDFAASGALRAIPPDPTQLAAVGGVDALAGGMRTLDAERLIAADPDVLLIPNLGGQSSTTPTRLKRSDIFSALRAVRMGRVYALPPGVTGFADNLVETPMRDRWLAEVLHPRLPGRTRDVADAAYATGLGQAPRSAELNGLLAVQANRQSFDGARMMAKP